MIDSVEPVSKEAEEKLIACCCVDGTSEVYDSLKNISEDDFYFYKHKLLFQAISNLSQGSTPIDNVSIMEYVKSIDCLDEVDGAVGICEILDAGCVIQDRIGPRGHHARMSRQQIRSWRSIGNQPKILEPHVHHGPGCRADVARLRGIDENDAYGVRSQAAHREAVPAESWSSASEGWIG